MAITDSRLKVLVELCDGSKAKLMAILEASYRAHPGRASEWHIERLESQLRPKVVAAKPVTEEQRRQLIRLCHGDRELAERLAKHERQRATSEAESWQRAIDNLLRDRQTIYSDSLYR